MSRNIRLLYIHNFLTDFRFQTAYLVIFFDQILGSYTAAMMIMAVEQISSALMDIPTGILSDRVGRRITLALGSLAAASGIDCYAFAEGLYWLIGGAFLLGLSGCLFNGNNHALLYETLKAEKRESDYHRYQGRTSSMFQLALGISALCSSLMTQHGLRLVFVAGIFPQIAAFFVSLFFIEPRLHTHEQDKNMSYLKKAIAQVWNNPRLRLLMLAEAISYGAGEAAFNFRNAFINQLWPTWALGVYRSINNAGGFIGFWFSGWLIDRVRPTYVLVICQLYSSVTQGIALVLSNAVSPLIFMTGALFYGPSLSAAGKLLQDDFSDQQRATMGSVASFSGSLFYALMAYAVGKISDLYGIVWGLGFGTAVSALTLPLYIKLFRRSFRHLMSDYLDRIFDHPNSNPSHRRLSAGGGFCVFL